MALLVALAVMSVTWTVVVAAVVLVQKVVPPHMSFDDGAAATIALGLSRAV